MSPVGRGELSLTKFYRLRELIVELGHIEPGMTAGEVRKLLGSGHEELVDDLVLYSNGRVIDDPLLRACRDKSADGPMLIWVALVMADHRLATVVEDVLTDKQGKLIPEMFDSDHLDAALVRLLPGTATRKAATNILSYYRDSGMVTPVTRAKTIIGLIQSADTAPSVPSVVAYVGLRLVHLGLARRSAEDLAELALGVRANAWVNLTPDEFRRASTPVGSGPTPPGLPARTASPPPAKPIGRESSSTQEVAVEAQNTERFLVSAQDERQAERREQSLVLAYKAWMKAGGSEIVRLRYRPSGSPGTLYCDLYDKTRNNLIEAKGNQTRSAIRMAIGQLADYQRFTEPVPRRAVLTPGRPREDLESLLASVGIACIWRRQEKFEDNADGQFV